MRYLYATFLIFLSAPRFVNAGIVPGCGDVAQGGEACNFFHLVQLVQNIINFFVRVSIPLAILLFLWAGVLILTAAGREAQITKAKQILQATAIGFIIVIAGWLIVRTVVNVLVPEDQRADYDQFLEQTR